jgi:hypothetical protein
MHGDGGFTLVELTVVAGLLVTVLAMLLTVLEGAQTNLGRDISRTTSNDQLRQAVEAIDREVRSGDVLYNPANETYNTGCSTAEFPTCGDIAGGMSMRIYTESNSPTRGSANCVQWRITSGGELQQRRWPINWQDNPSALVVGWHIVATNITNRSDGIAAFVQPTAGGSPVTNLLNIDLRVNQDPTQKKGSTVEVKATLSGRNTLQFPSGQQCGPVPPDPTVTTAPAGAKFFTPLPPY